MDASDLLSLQQASSESDIWRLVTPEKFQAVLKEPSFAGTVDGKLLACGGIIQLWPGLAEAWIAVMPEAKLHTHFLCRKTGSFLRSFQFIQKVRRIQTTIQTDFTLAITFAERLGFKREADLPSYGPHGETYSLYSMVL